MASFLCPCLFWLACAASDSASPPNTGGSSVATGDSAELIPPATEADPSLLCNITLTCGGNVLDEPKVPCEIEMVSGNGVALYSGPAGVELRGRSSLTFPKPQYSVELRAYSELPIWPGFTWRYLDDGSDPGPNWAALDFDDSAWPEGPAPLGYGADWLNTEVSAGDNPNAVHPTIYYRYHFPVAAPEQVSRLTLGVIRNDAAAAYLNDTEVLRENLNATADYATYAREVISPEDELTWLETEVDPGLLEADHNVMAVEIHQAEPDSPDSRFDLFLDAAGNAVDIDLLGMGEESDWVLNGLYVDRVLFRNKLALDLFQSLGGEERYAAESVFCELTLAGEYQGIYALGEKIKRADSRLDLHSSEEPGDTFIIKLDDAAGFYTSTVGVGNWQMVYPADDDDAEAAVAAHLAAWEAAIHGDDPGNPDTGMWSFVDLDSAVDWVLLQELTKNVDAYQLSVYLWRDEGGKMYFSPWDFDLSMGYPYYDCGATGWLTRLEYVDAMAANADFRAALVARWWALREDQFSDAAISERIAAYDATLAPAIERNFERWPIEDIAFSTDTWDNWLCPVSSYEEEHERVLTFLEERLAWIDDNIADY